MAGALPVVSEVEPMTESNRQTEACGEKMADIGSKPANASSVRRIAVIDQGVCTLCGVCASSCPQEAIRLTDVVEVDAEACSGCGVCISACPVHAMGLLTLKS